VALKGGLFLPERRYEGSENLHRLLSNKKDKISTKNKTFVGQRGSIFSIRKIGQDINNTQYCKYSS
jgi:hypothetical protein